MKTITRFFFLVAALIASTSMGYAAQATVNFETVGNNWTWSGFEFAPVWSITANPATTGINASTNAAKIVVNPGDKPWAGVECAKGDFGPLTLSASSKIIKIMVYKDVISPVGIKLITSTNGSKGELKVSNTKINEWEELIFDFTSQIDPGMIYTAVAIFPDFPADRTAGSTTYIDNIVYEQDAVVTDAEIPTDFTATANTPDATSVSLKLKATDNSGTVKFTITYGTTVLNTSGASNTEIVYPVVGLTASTAYSFSVVCKDAAGNAAANNPIVIPVTTAAPLAASPTPTSAPADVLSIYSDTYTTVAPVQAYENWWNGTWSEVTLADAGKAKIFMSTNGGGGGGIGFYDANAVDVSAMTYLHVDIYPTTSTVGGLKYNVVPVGGGGTGWTSFPTLVANQWNKVDIMINTLGIPSGVKVQQIGFGTFGVDGNFYIDNAYFSKTLPTSVNTTTADVKLSYFPNPTHNNLTIAAKSEISELMVRNLVGQHIRTVKVNANSATLSLSDLSAGNYFVIAKMANGQVSTQKITKL